jgi:hypothetical protein
MATEIVDACDLRVGTARPAVGLAGAHLRCVALARSKIVVQDARAIPSSAGKMIARSARWHHFRGSLGILVPQPNTGGRRPHPRYASCLRALAARCARALTGITLEKRGRRECRVHAAPAVSCAMESGCAHEHTGSAEASGIPCVMALRLMPCSPRRRIRLVTVVGGFCGCSTRSGQSEPPPTWHQQRVSEPHGFAVR